MKKVYWLVIGVIGAGLSLTPVVAGDHSAKDVDARFAKLDADGNGSVSFEEFKTVNDRRLEKMKEKLGDKYDPAKAPNAEESFARIDADHSGGISKEELAADHEKSKKDKADE